MPSALGIGGKTRQNDLDIAFQFTFFTGADANAGQAGGSNSLNIRQAYMTFGDASWGTVKLGRDLGIFGSDAILSDMTLLGVGIGAGAGGTSTLGRIGTGYVYADWVGQISYHSPNWNGFSFAVGMREPWSNGTSDKAIRSDLGFEGKATYEWAGDVAGKVWAGFISQKHDKDTAVNPLAADDYTSKGWELGGKVSFGGLTLVGNYYDGDGLSGAYGQASGLAFLGNNDSDDNGGYVQATYVLPGIGTKLGASWGVSKSEPKGSNAEFENEAWIVGVYHPLTKSLNLVAEYTDNDYEDFGGIKGNDAEAKTFSLGAIMFF